MMRQGAVAGLTCMLTVVAMGGAFAQTKAQRAQDLGKAKAIGKELIAAARKQDWKKVESMDDPARPAAERKRFVKRIARFPEEWTDADVESTGYTRTSRKHVNVALVVKSGSTSTAVVRTTDWKITEDLDEAGG